MEVNSTETPSGAQQLTPVTSIDRDNAREHAPVPIIDNEMGLNWQPTPTPTPTPTTKETECCPSEDKNCWECLIRRKVGFITSVVIYKLANKELGIFFNKAYFSSPLSLTYYRDQNIYLCNLRNQSLYCYGQEIKLCLFSPNYHPYKWVPV